MQALNDQLAGVGLAHHGHCAGLQQDHPQKIVTLHRGRSRSSTRRRPWGSRAFRLALLLICAVLSVAVHAQGRRVALLVGNDAYEPGRLSFPAQDVEEIRKALLTAGFPAGDIQTERNADQRRLRRAIQEFGRRAQGADVAFFYFSGHGAQVQGQNWLIPVGAEIHTEAGYELEAVSAQAALSQLSAARPRVAVVVLDACRDNPLAVSRSGTKGLARMEAGDRTLVAFATAPNDTAADTGLYARVLARHLQTPGMELLDAFRNTTADVRRQTSGRQVPRVSEVTLDERVVLVPAASPPPAPAPAIQHAGVQESPLKLDDIEAEHRGRQQVTRQLAQMQRDFDRVQALTSDADLQRQAWERFLTAWANDLPSTSDDDALRDRARQRLQALRPQPAQTLAAAAALFGPTQVATSPATTATGSPPPAAALQLRTGQILTYRITDLYTRNSRLVKLHVSKTDGDVVEFDGGARKEGPGGALLPNSTPALSALDSYQPPDGWWQALPKSGNSSSIEYRILDGSRVSMKLSIGRRGASHAPENASLAPEVIELRGQVDVTGLGTARHELKGTMHFSKSLQRVVLMELDVQGPRSHSSFNRDVRERVELVSVE